MTKMNTMSFILDQRSIEIKRYIIEFTIFDKLTFRRVKLNIILMSIVRAYIAHGFQRMCCWCDKCYIVSISESTAIYVANHAAIFRVFESSKQLIYIQKTISGKEHPLVSHHLSWKIIQIESCSTRHLNIDGYTCIVDNVQ